MEEEAAFRYADQFVRNSFFLSLFLQGNVVQDTVSFPGSPAWNVTYVYFGQIESDNVPGDFVIPPEDGIMGFAFQALSAWQQPCVFSHMGVYQSFSTCLTVSPPPVFEMGTNYRGTQRAAFNWTTMYSDPGWLSVWLSDTGMAGQTLGISASSLNSQSVIVDTGTTFIICSTEMMKVQCLSYLSFPFLICFLFRFTRLAFRPCARRA